MNEHDYGPLRRYEVTWKSGHIETVQGHQILFDSSRAAFTASLGGVFGVTTETAETPARFYVHGMFDGHWRLVLTGLETELVTLRDVTDREQVPGGESA